jgi:hypothetical protein
MTDSRAPCGASVGVVEHGNSAELVTVAPDATLVDRRRIDLTESDDIALPDAIALV